MRTLSEQVGPPQWTPGAGWERLKREMPHLVPELTDEDMRRAAAMHAAAADRGGDGPRRST
ncbi:hypothetical protein [Dactylosporangium sp. CS-033363]|uniref:hypothetical protein n=1 Tax=Dactylosporangium sp. CS-033363 TaxID=3239935 RepID=UPI003D8EE572